MAEKRPDPDALLAIAQRQEAKRTRGSLKIFFGAAAGVGKTYAMLSDAREKRADGVDVVVGIVETHGRSETAALVESLEVLPPRIVSHRGTQVKEFDLDAARARKPALILVDELAHTNVEGSRHPKRWNDVQELIDAGIDVYTTLNVQHLESLNDIVGGITHVRVWETVPDTVFERADEVELVDLPPDDLLERLKEGKVYLPQQAEHAIRNFFRKGNLIALRELALRRTAERVDAQMRDYREDEAIREVWRAGERVLVCISPNVFGERLVRAGKRIASATHAQWIVAYVETPKLQRLPAARRDEVMRYLRLAEDLGAETVTLSAPDMAREILRYARERNVSRIIMGKPTRTGWRRWLLGSVVDSIVRDATDIDVHLLALSDAAPFGGTEREVLTRSRAYLGLREDDPYWKRRYPGYLWALFTTALATLVCGAIYQRFELSNLVMMYLVAVVFVAARFGRGPSVLVSILGVAAFDFFFVAPRFTFAVTDVQYVVTFIVMLLVGLVISSLAANLRSQAKVAAHRERRAGVLYGLARELAAAQDEEAVALAAVKHIAAEFEGAGVLLFADANGKIQYPRGQSISGSFHAADLAVAQWVYDHGEIAGQGTDTLPGTEGVYFPLKSSTAVLGVLTLLPANLRRIFLPEQRRLIDTFLSQIVLALERIRLGREAQTANVRIETESLRNSLLNAISHDFRTPLSSIVGASSSLVDSTTRLTEAERLELSKTIHEEAQRMTRLANNLLDMARLQAGATLNRQWSSLEEIVGSVLTRLQKRLSGHRVDLDVPSGFPLLLVDATLLAQVFENLLENAVKYTPAGTPVEIGARHAGGEFELWVADRGPGLPHGAPERLFEKFYRGESERAQSGIGLGLTICRAIVEAHGGRMRAEARDGGGATFRFILPVTAAPPASPVEALETVSA